MLVECNLAAGHKLVRAVIRTARITHLRSKGTHEFVECRIAFELYSALPRDWGRRDPIRQRRATTHLHTNLRKAAALLQEAGWGVENGRRVNADGQPLHFTVLLRQGDTQNSSIMDLYVRALERLGISVRVDLVDNAQYTARESEQDFDITSFRRDLSLSPGNEQRLYWGSGTADRPGTRNLMGVESPALDAAIDAMLVSETREDFISAARALDRILTSGRYVIPLWQYDVDRIAHAKELKFPDYTPVYGDRPGFLPEVWWYAQD